MKSPAFAIALFSTALFAPMMGLADSKTPTIEELWQIIQAQQEEIAALKQQQQNTDKKVTAADEKAEAAVVAVESGVGTASATGNWVDRTHIGGYGELHYNNVEGSDDEIDLHRFVLFLGHEFNDDIRFFSEFEVEHSLAGEGKNGEVEIEQAYIEFDIRDGLQAKGGLFLLPVGILNETHEPNTFYGVERNNVENIIIPATWWAGGAALSGQSDSGFSWDLALHEGLAVPTLDEDNEFRIRSGRQKTSEAIANNFAATGRVRYTGVPGLELAASLQYQSDISQQDGDGLEEGLLFETHVSYEKGPFGLRALYAEWNLDGSDVKAVGADEQKGWYLEPAFKPREDLGVYARYEDLEGYRSSDQFEQWEVGVNFWPHEDVVLKADYRDRDLDSGTDFSAFDLGIGYQF
jgi:predicted porin